jgi:hypothetical protein
MNLVGIALFQFGGNAAWPVASSGSISDVVLEEIERVYGVRVR